MVNNILRKHKKVLLLILVLVFTLSFDAQSQVISYDFESNDGGWTVSGQNSGGSWTRTNSLGQFESGNSGYAFQFTPHNNYGAYDAAHVTSPAINLTTHSSMTLSINIRYNTESGYDGMNIYYSVDGTNWTILGSNGAPGSTNWYNNTGVDGINDRYSEVTSDPHGWSGDNSSWQTATIPIPSSLETETNVYFRIYFGSDSGVQDDGAAFDDFVITGTPKAGITKNASFSTFSSCSGSAGTAQTFTVSVTGGAPGLGLSINSPTGYEVSLDGNTYLGNLMIPDDGLGDVPSTTVYVRLTSSASNGATGDITLLAGSYNETIATGSGTVNSPPSVSAGSDIGYTAGGTISFDATVSGNISSSTSVFSEDFGSGSLPSGWTNSGGDESWSIRTTDPGYGTGTDNTAGSDNGMAWHDNSSSSGEDNAEMYTGVLDLSSYSNADLTFYGYNTNPSQSTLDINISVNGGSSYTDNVCTFNGTYNSWTQLTCNLGNTYMTNNTVIQFEGNDITGYASDFGLDDISLVGNKIATYAWSTDASNGNTGWSATNTEDITVTSSAASNHIGNYTLTVTDINGCQASDVVAVTSSPTISTSASFSTFVSCQGSAGTEQSFTISGANLTNNIVVTAPTGYEVSKTSGSSFGSSITFTQSSGSVASSSVYVRLTSSASNSASGNIACTSTGATTVNEATGAGTVSSAPTASAAGADINQCNNGSFTMAANSPSSGTGAWSVVSGSATITSSSSNTSGITSVAAGAAATLRWTISNGTCTASTDDVVITNNSLPTVTASVSESSGAASNDGTICSGDNVTLSGGGATSYSWNNSVTNGVAFSPGSTTTYTVTGTDGNSCQNTAQQTVTVSTTVATVNAGSDITVNYGDALSIDATVSSDGSSVSHVTQNFASGTINEGNSSTFMSQVSSNSSHSGSHGYWRQETTSSDASCSGCSSYRAYITSGSPAGGDSYLYINEFTPSSSSVTISFNYGHSNRTHSSDNYDAFKVYLDASSGSDVVLVNHANNAGSGFGQSNEDMTYNQSVSVTAGVTYKFVVLYENSNYANGLYGASIDNISVTESGSPVYSWTTNASNGNSGWSATNTVDITVSNSATADHSGNYTLTTTHGLSGCDANDVVAVTVQVPSISTSGSLSAFSACNGSNSAEQSFTISGTYLQANLVVTPPSGYEVSTTSGSSFASSVTLTPSSGTVNSTTVYVRTTTGASNGNGGNIACTSTNATTSNLATGSATIVAVPNAGTLSGNTALNIGSTVTITTSGDAGGTWSSDNTSAATVNSSTGAVTAAGIGNAVITYTKSASPCSDATATRTVTVTNNFLTTGTNSNWSNTACWGGGVVPPSSGDVTISHDINVDASTNTLGTVTIDASKTLTVATGQTITAGGTSDINGTLSIAGTGKYDANGTFDATNGNVTFTGTGTLELGGTVTSLGTFTGVSGATVKYDGTSTQTIFPLSSKFAYYPNLSVENSEKTLSAMTLVDGDLTFGTDHDIATNGHTLVIKETPTGYNDSRLIKGGTSNTVTVSYSSSSTNECFIPVGIDGDVRDISITAASASGETYTVVYTPGSPYGGAGTLFQTVPTGAPINSSADAAHVNNHYYYDISRSGSVNATLKLKFSGLTEPASNSDKYVMHWDGSEWDQLTSTGASGYVTALATSFSPFGQGSGGSALPIDLVSFEGKCENNKTELEFVVASQINNDYFSIFRSQNTTEWSAVGEIEGAGNTSTQMTYNWVDENPMSGYNYYRLVQTDYDGTSEGFDPIAVRCESAPVDGYSVYPNPANEVLNIDLKLEHNQGDDVSIEVIDINGKIIQLQQVQLTRGYNHLEVDLSEIPSGIYMINFAGTKDYIKESRIVKQ